jgi:exosome complex component RRP45
MQHLPTERAPVPLAIHHIPFCFTFAFFPNATTPPVLDPLQLEQRLSAGLVSNLRSTKTGGVPLGTDDIL